jgi:TPP-dependent 2-oxoacid decarboxylase
MKVIIYSRIGNLYVKIHEKEIKSEEELENTITEWRYADLIEVFDCNKLVYTYTKEEEVD